jgi:hypothetical protein
MQAGLKNGWFVVTYELDARLIVIGKFASSAFLKISMYFSAENLGCAANDPLRPRLDQPSM